MRNKKALWQFLEIVCFLVLGFGILSCSSDKKVKVGFLLPHLTNERYPKDSALFSEEIKRLGAEVFIKSANFSESLQEQQVQELIDQGVDILVIIPVNKNTAGVMVRNAHNHKIKVISYERMIANSEVDFFISFDNVKVGEIMANYAVKQKSEGTFALLGGDKSDQNALWVKEGQMNVLKPYIESGKVKIVFDVFVESWNKENSNFEFRRYLKLSSEDIPDVVLTGGDAMAAGAIDALEAIGISVDMFPLLTGQNAESQGCRNIVNGKQTMTVYKPIKQIVSRAADIAMKMIRNEPVEYTRTTFNGSVDVPTVLIEPIGVNKDNMSIIVKDEFLKETQIYGDK